MNDFKTFTIQKNKKRSVDLGYKPVRQRGSHVFFENSHGRGTVVPNHPGEDIGRGLLRKIIKDLEIEPDEFMKGI
ncbi:MAG: hypothetical protein HeimC3_37650 [Candidatus Heimdallarchaeota archaeon LC_3]|nr:MAG: hypothetical protein HeimC3_50740 [Candidatus Heimdallarchaeota archaeon LC_3]OLS21016.1 MAG: hypothetical protein HeimC3_37650 [Candidatus Heimdallarchaeota archaeon LC_3]